MSRQIACAVVALALVIGAALALPPPESFKGQAALDEVRAFLAVGPRAATTPGAERAARHLAERLRVHGVQAEVDSFADRCPKGTGMFHNVIGRLGVPNKKVIILAGHFDTFASLGPEFEGANDSGSSTGVLLHLASLLAHSPALPWEIWIVFFDGEEAMVRYGPNDGLHGSRRLVGQLASSGRLKDVEAFILLDMVGDRDLTVTLPRNSTSWLLREVLQAAHDEGVRRHFSLYSGEILDDHVPFLRAGVPAVNIIDFEYGSRPGANNYWHTLEDRLDKLSAESLEIIGRVVLRLLHRLAQRDAPTSR